MPIGNTQYIIDAVTPTIRNISLDTVNQYGNNGTITNITAGTGLSTSVGTSITSSGTIFLDANINDLNDVDINSAVNNQVLSFDGTSWINKTYAGLNGASVAFTDLTDVYITGGNNLSNASDNLFYVNTAGTSLIAKPLNDFVQTITSGYAIDVTRTNSLVNIGFASDKINIVSSTLESSDYIHAHDNTTNKAVRQTFQTTPLSLFLNDNQFITRGELIEGDAIDITLGTSVTIGVCTLGIGVSVGGITGVLPITKGGTAGTTSASARENLQLEYNVDILPVSGPSFRETMYGNNLNLLNNGFGLSLISGGTSYVNGNPLILVNLNTNDNITMSNLTITSISGIITAPINTGVSITNINLLDYGVSYAVYGTSGVSAYYQLTPDNINLTIGNSIGFRNNLGVLEVKTTSSSNWTSYFPIDFNDVNDINITTSTLGTSSLLIYNGSNWINTNLTGDSNFDVDLIISGTSTILQIGPCPGTIDATAINPGTISNTEFGYLNGLTDNIQTQLNNKLGPSPNGQTPNNGDVIVNNGSCWVLTSVPSSDHGYFFGVSYPYTPSFDYLYNFFTTSVNFSFDDWQNSYFINIKSGTSPGYRVSLANFLEDNLLSGTSSGLDFSVDKQLKLEVNGLSEGYTFPTKSSDFIPYYNNSTGTNLKINIENLASQLAGDGLNASIGTLEIGNLTEALKLYNYGLSGNLPSASLNINSLAGISDNSLTGTSLVYSNGTSWFYVQLGNYI